MTYEQGEMSKDSKVTQEKGEMQVWLDKSINNTRNNITYNLSYLQLQNNQITDL